MSEELDNYIKEARAHGMGDEEIKKSLLEAGWSQDDVEWAISASNRVVSDKIEQPATQTSTQSTQPSSEKLDSPIHLFRNAWHIYKARFKTFLGVILLPLLSYLPLLLIILAFVILQAKLSGESAVISIVYIVLALLGLASVIFAIYVNVWGQPALVTAIKDRVEGVGVKESYRRSRSKVGSYFWVGLLSGIVVLGGFILLIVPGIIFAVWFSFAAIILVTEGEKGMRALLKSKEYVRGRWFAVLGRLLFIFVIAVLISWVPTLLFNFINLAVVGQILSWVLSFLFPPLLITYLFLLYNKLRQLRGEFVFQAQGRGKFIALGIIGALIIPLAIFGIGYTALRSARVLSRDSKRQLDISQIKTALTLYYADQSAYPDSLTDLSDYLAVTPTDPSTDQVYAYRLLPDGRGYEVCAVYEKRGRVCETETQEGSDQNQFIDSQANALLRQQYQLALLEAREWNADAELHGYRRIYSTPPSFDDQLLSQADSYWFLSENEAIVYEPIVDRIGNEVSRIDENLPYEVLAGTLPVLFPPLIGPDQALQIAETYPGFSDFEHGRPDQTFVYAALSNPNIFTGPLWEIVVTTDLADLPSGETVTILVDPQSGEIKSTIGL